ncbi:hypothetical protein ABIF86_000394 [Bradyrhizobium japonicum]
MSLLVQQLRQAKYGTACLTRCLMVVCRGSGRTNAPWRATPCIMSWRRRIGWASSSSSSANSEVNSLSRVLSSPRRHEPIPAAPGGRRTSNPPRPSCRRPSSAVRLGSSSRFPPIVRAWGAKIGPSPAPMRAAGMRLQSTPSSPPRSSTTATRRLGWRMSWPAYRIIPPSASMNSCLGTGDLPTQRGACPIDELRNHLTQLISHYVPNDET